MIWFIQSHFNRILPFLWLFVFLASCSQAKSTQTARVEPEATPAPVQVTPTRAQLAAVPSPTAETTREEPPDIIPSYWSTPTAPTARATPENANFDALAQQMLDLVNQARAKAGVQPLAWDPVAAEAGRRHAADMVRLGYFSHRNPDGLGPDHRYSLAGGQHAVRENLHAFSYTYPDGRGAPIDDWQEVIANAHQNLMESPGHRENILAPAHTHLGVGMAYNPQTGEFRLAEEFTNQYVRLEESVPLVGQLGQSIPVRGTVPVAGVENLLLSLAYEPFPEPLTVEELNQTGVYVSAAESVTVWRLDSLFDRAMPLDSKGRAGFYHVRIFGDVQGEQALLVDQTIAAHP